MVLFTLFTDVDDLVCVVVVFVVVLDYGCLYHRLFCLFVVVVAVVVVGGCCLYRLLVLLLSLFCCCLVIVVVVYCRLKITIEI